MICFQTYPPSLSHTSTSYTCNAMQTTPKKMEESSLTPPDLNVLLSVCLTTHPSLSFPLQLMCLTKNCNNKSDPMPHSHHRVCLSLSRRSYYTAAAAAAAGDVQASIKAANKWISGRNPIHQKN